MVRTSSSLGRLLSGLDGNFQFRSIWIAEIERSFALPLGDQVRWHGAAELSNGSDLLGEQANVIP